MEQAGRRARQKKQLKQFTVQTRTSLEQRSGQGSGGGGATSTSLSEEDPETQALLEGVMRMMVDAVERYSAEAKTRPLVPTESNALLNQRQLDLDRSLQLPPKEVRRLERCLSDAMLAGKLFAVAHCFTLVHHQHRPYEGPAPYEQLSNEHEAEEVSANQLSVDMMRHEWHYRALLQRCRYLEQRQPPLQYVLYKRGITLLDGNQALHSKTPFYQAWFQPHRHGHYYALTVNFGLSAQGVARGEESI